MTTAEATLQRAKDSAAPHRQRLHDVGWQIRDHDRDSATLRMLDQWTDDRRHQQLVNLDVALDGWQRWASGHRLTPTELDDTIQHLESADTDPGATRSLAHAMRTWADDNGIDLATPAQQLQPHLARTRISLEIDM